MFPVADDMQKDPLRDVVNVMLVKLIRKPHPLGCADCQQGEQAGRFSSASCAAGDVERSIHDLTPLAGSERHQHISQPAVVREHHRRFTAGISQAQLAISAHFVE